MELKIGNFHVKDVVFGSETSYADGVLTINKEEMLKMILTDKRITKCDIQIARPGDDIRILPVKTSIEARCKVSGGYAYPGQVNPLSMVGEGVTHCLKDMSIITVGKYGGFQRGLLIWEGRERPIPTTASILISALSWNPRMKRRKRSFPIRRVFPTVRHPIRLRNIWDRR